MEAGDPAAYGEAFADVYDDWYGDISDTNAAVDVLEELAANGRLLELGVGTGRISIPLADRGVRVDGIDASPAMLARLHSKAGGQRVSTHLGNMADISLSGPFAVVFVAFNTFFNLTSEESQRQCLRRSAAVLGPGGVVVLEAFVPAQDSGVSDASDVDEREEVQRRGTDTVRTVSAHDPLSQRVSGVHIQTGPEGRVTERPWEILYRTVDQLDELCADVGLGLRARWRDWKRTAFDADAERHISVYAPLD